MVGATTRRRGLELISAHNKLAKALYTVRVFFKNIEHKARYSYKGISPSEASWWLHLTIYDQNRFRMPIIPRIPDFTNVHFYKDWVYDGLSILSSTTHLTSRVNEKHVTLTLI